MRGRHRRQVLALDTMCFLYRFEANATYLDLTRDLFDLIERGECRATTSVLSLTESLVAPLRLGRAEIAATYRTIFTNFPNLDLVPVDVRAAEVAAELRTRHGLRTPDALHLAAAVAAGADAFITNDAALTRVTEVEVIPLRA
jgi:predicted nucleic acid-binding protein